MIATANTNTTNTTTTTTLYSAITNSIGSLVVGQSGNISSSNNRAKTNSVRQEPTISRLKNTSFSGSTARGSGATLLGAPGLVHNALNSNHLPLIMSRGGVGVARAVVSSGFSRSIDSNRTTLMLIVVVTVFLMVEVPVAIVTILHVVLNLFDVFKDIQIDSSLDYIKLFTNFFIAVSYSVNFSIYCSMSKKFRETFRDLFMCGKRKRKRAQKSLHKNSRNFHTPNQQQITQTFQPSSNPPQVTHDSSINISHNLHDHLSQSTESELPRSQLLAARGGATTPVSQLKCDSIHNSSSTLANSKLKDVPVQHKEISPNPANDSVEMIRSVCEAGQRKRLGECIL